MFRLDNIFFVFRSRSYTYARWICLILPLILYFVSWKVGQIWVFIVSIPAILFLMVFFFYLCTYVKLSSEGILLKKFLIKPVYIHWEDILCCGSFHKGVPGMLGTIEFIYFSKKTISYSSLVNNVALPSLSSDFIFIAHQPGLEEAINELWKEKKVRLVLNKHCMQHPTHIQRARTQLAFFVYILHIASILCLFMLIYARDIRWLLAGCFFTICILIIKLENKKK